MATTIGLYVHRVRVYDHGSARPATLNAYRGKDVLEITQGFIDKAESAPLSDRLQQRSIQLEPRPHNEERTLHGLVSYGTFGFESRFKDSRTGEETFRRAVTDQEEIPLYYQIWIPEGEDFGLIILQTFGMRSCVIPFQNGLREHIRSVIGKTRVDFDQLVPSEALRSYANAPVKQVRLISRKVHGSDAQRYVRANADGPDEGIGTIEVVVTPERRHRFGIFRELQEKYKGAPDELLSLGDIQFDEARAEIEVNGRSRTVTLAGPKRKMGLLDITQTVEVMPSGHPSFNSVSNHADSTMYDFAAVLT